MSVTDLLLKAKSSKAEELMFVVGSEPRMRGSQGWQTLRNSPALVSEWNILLQSLLSSQQKATLENKGFITGETAMNNFRMGFSFVQNETTMKAVLDMNLDGHVQELQIPPALMDSCLQMKGMVLLSSAGDLGQVWALHKILQNMGEQKSFVAAVISRRAFPQIKENNACFIYHTGNFASSQDREVFLEGVDMVVFEGFSGEEYLQEAVELAEQGYFVVYSMRAPHLMNCLRRSVAHLENEWGEHAAPRLAGILSLASAQYSISGLGDERVFAHEVLLMKPQLKEKLEAADIKSIGEILESTTETPGILTLNQSLLQHLIRRRIDLKSAFEVTHNPDNLDQLLKKVGI